MGKQLIGNNIGSYSFDASAQTVTISGVGTLTIDQILSIVNVTDQIIIYSAVDDLIGGSVSSNVISLEHDTTSMSDTDALQIWVELPDSETAFTVNNKIEGSTSGNIAEVTASNELKVVTATPTNPTGTTKVTIIGDTPLDVSGNANQYTYFTIPNAETLSLQNFYVSFEGRSAQAKFELYDDPLGTNPTGPNGGDNIPASWVRITIIYLESGAFNFPLSDLDTYLGDGTRRIVVRRKRMDGGTREMFARADGYY